MKRSDGFYNKKSYISTSTTPVQGAQVGWPAVGVVLCIALALEFVPSNAFRFGADKISDPRAELGGGPYTPTSNNIQTRLHALNEIGIIMARDEAYKDARKKLENDHNRGFLAIQQLSSTINQSLNHKRPDGKTMLEHGMESSGKMIAAAETEAENWGLTEKK